jgi:hypothetical protein
MENISTYSVLLVEETEGWNEHTSPCIGIELANLRLDIRLPLAYIFNANL